MVDLINTSEEGSNLYYKILATLDTDTFIKCCTLDPPRSILNLHPDTDLFYHAIIFPKKEVEVWDGKDMRTIQPFANVPVYERFGYVIPLLYDVPADYRTKPTGEILKAAYEYVKVWKKYVKAYDSNNYFDDELIQFKPENGDKFDTERFMRSLALVKAQKIKTK